VKDKKKCESVTWALSRLVCLGFWLGGTMAFAATPSFSNGSLKGSYEVLLVVWTSPENVTNQGYLGIATFDGSGNVSGSFTINTGGTITTDSFSGTYSVKANGSGALSMTDAQQNKLQLALVINSTGLQFLQTNPTGTAVMNGTGTPQGSTSFSNATLKGTYGFGENKWDTTSDPGSSEPDATLGLLTFDGVGKIKASFTDEHKGQVNITSGTGTYSVNSDGSASASVTLSNKRQVTFAVVINSAGKGFRFQGTNCGCGNAVLAGTAIHQ
jgi:hypothetical protein